MPVARRQVDELDVFTISELTELPIFTDAAVSFDVIEGTTILLSEGATLVDSIPTASFDVIDGTTITFFPTISIPTGSLIDISTDSPADFSSDSLAATATQVDTDGPESSGSQDAESTESNTDELSTPLSSAPPEDNDSPTATPTGDSSNTDSSASAENDEPIPTDSDGTPSASGTAEEGSDSNATDAESSASGTNSESESSIEYEFPEPTEDNTNVETPPDDPDVDEMAGIPTEAAPSTATYSKFEISVSDAVITAAYTGEVVAQPTPSGYEKAPPEVVDDLLDVLQSDPDTSAYGALLSSMPAIRDLFESGKEYYVFAPTNEIVAAFLEGMSEEQSKVKSREATDDVAPDASYSTAEKTKDGPDLRYEEVTLKTTLHGEIEYVTLGEGEPARVVSKPADPQDGNKGSIIISGFGNHANVDPNAIPFKAGVILKVDRFFTKPTDLRTTFKYTSGKKFSTDLKDAGLVDQLADTAKVTVLALSDEHYGSEKLDEGALNRLLIDGLLYTPDIKDNICLKTRNGQLQVSKDGEDIRIGGAKVVKNDVISRNGVVHYLDGIPDDTPCQEDSTTGTDDESSDEGSGASSLLLPVVFPFAIGVVLALLA